MGVGGHRKNKPQRTRRTRKKKQTTENTEKANHRGHREHGDRKRGGADTLVRPYKARHWVEQRAVGKGGPGRLESRPQARKPAPQRTRHGGHRKNKPQRTRRTRRWEKRGRLEVEGAVVRATPPALAVEGVGKPGQVVGVWLCRRDRRHGKPGGLLHFGGGGLRWRAQSCGPRRQPWRWRALGSPGRWWVCGAAGVTAGMASLAACSTRTSGVASKTACSTRTSGVASEAARSAQRRRARVSPWAD